MDQVQIAAGQTNVVEGGAPSTGAADVNSASQGNEASAVQASGQVENPASTEQGNGSLGQGNGANNTAPNDGADGSQEGQDSGTVKRQDSATNKRFAEIRRSYEKRLRDAEKAQADAVKAKEVEMVKSLYKTNQWTGKPIEDEYDVEEFLAMKALSEEGHDPLTAYPEQLKQKQRSVAQEAREKLGAAEAKETKAKAHLKEFREKYKDVNISELLSDKEFLDFGAQALEIMPLAKVYEAYLPIKQKRAELQKAEALAANSRVAVGSVTSAMPTEDSEFFTKEQVLKMSQAEISKNYEKIRASQMKW